MLTVNNKLKYMLLLLKKILNQFLKYFGYSIYNIHKTDDYIRIQEISNYENELINKKQESTKKKQEQINKNIMIQAHHRKVMKAMTNQKKLNIRQSSWMILRTH